MRQVIKDVKDGSFRIKIIKNLIGYRIELYKDETLTLSFRATKNILSDAENANAYIALTNDDIYGVIDYKDHFIVEGTNDSILRIESTSLN